MLIAPFTFIKTVTRKTTQELDEIRNKKKLHIFMLHEEGGQERNRQTQKKKEIIREMKESK